MGVWFQNANFTWAVGARVLSLLFAIAFAAVMGRNIFGRKAFFPYISIPMLPEVQADLTPSFTQPFAGQSYTNPVSNVSTPQSFYLSDARCSLPVYNDVYRQVFSDVLFINPDGYLQTKLVDSGRAIGVQTALFSFQIVVIFFELVMFGMLYWKVGDPNGTKIATYTWTTQEMGFNIVRKVMTIGCEIIYTVIACAVGGIRSELDIIVLCLLVIGWNLAFMSVQAFSVFSTAQLEDRQYDMLKQHFEMFLNTDLAMSILLEGLWAAVIISSGFNFSFKTFTTVVPFGSWTHYMTPVVSAIIIAPPFYLFGVHLMIVIFAFARAWMQSSYNDSNASNPNDQSQGKDDDVRAWKNVVLFVDNLDAFKFIGFNLIIFLCVEVWAQTSYNQIPALSCIT